MGVLGLTSFIENNPQLLEPLNLHDTRLVVDGHGLVHWLFHHNKIGFKHGGNYAQYEELCKIFFQFLKLCNIQAYVLFDGAYDVDDKKLQTVKERAKQQILRSRNIINGGGDKILPVFAFEVFVKVVEVMEIPFVFCDFEADNDIVALANAWQCPVLGQDSDFFIFDIKAGYIQLAHLWWKNPYILHTREDSEQTEECHKASKMKKYYVKAEMYTQQRFCTHFSFDKNLVPLMASLLGNDYIPSETFKDFYSQIRLPTHFVKSISRRNAHVQGTIYWLSDFDDVKAASPAVLKYLRKTDREPIRKKLETSMQMYDLQEGSKFMNYFDRRHMDAGLLLLPECQELAGWSVALFRRGRLPSFCVNVICQRRHFTFDLIEDIMERSCNECSLFIRKTLYGILLKQSGRGENEGCGDSAQGGVVSAKKKRHHVVEFDRDCLELRQTHVEPLHVLPSYGDIPHLLDIPTLSEAARKCLIMEVLGADPAALEHIPPEIHLPMAVTIFWVNNAEPKVSTTHIQALLLGFVRGYLLDVYAQEMQASQEMDGDCSIQDSAVEGACSQETGESTPCKDDAQHSMKQLLVAAFRKHEDAYKRDRLSLSAVQVYAQWQSCMKYAAFFNLILCQPYPVPDMTMLYSGTLVHSMNAALHSLLKTETDDWIKTSLLEGLTDAYRLYASLHTSVISCLSPGALYQKNPRKPQNVPGVTSEVKGQSQQGETRGQGGVTKSSSPPVTYEVNCDIVNRFAGLTTTEED